jgi:hypothetical protein
VLRKAAYIETAGGVVRVRTKDGVQLVAPVSDLTRVRGSWWRPGGFSVEAEGRRHKMAASIRNGPDNEGSGWFTDTGRRAGTPRGRLGPNSGTESTQQWSIRSRIGEYAAR